MDEVNVGFTLYNSSTNNCFPIVNAVFALPVASPLKLGHRGSVDICLSEDLRLWSYSVAMHYMIDSSP